MTQIRTFVILLALVASTACTGGLLADNRPSPTLQPVAADTKPDVPLTNTYWKLIELNGKSVGPGEDGELHMILKGQNEVSGNAGCNRFFGSYTTNGNTVSVGPIAATRRMCEGVMDQEDAFLQALENAVRFEITGEDLAVFDGQGSVTMRFVAVYME